MKCPICGINHRKINKVDICESRINNEWIHYIILCSGMPGGITEENLKRYKSVKLKYFREVKKKKEQMDEYVKGFNKKSGYAELADFIIKGK